MNGSALAFLVRAFYGEKKERNILTYITRRKEKSQKKKKKKIREEENSLELERAHARHLDLRLYALIQCATYTLTLSAPYF